MKVHIQDPCKENWNEMTPQEQGRHCAKCDKVVVDFTKMNDYEILSHVNGNSNTCGRFHNWQVEKELTLPKLHNPWTRWIKNAAFSGFLFGGALSGKSQDTAQVDTVIQTTQVEPIDIVSQPTRVVKGIIHQPEDSIHQLKELQFSIDSFRLSLAIVSDELSFDIPDSVKGNSLRIYALSDSTKTELTLPIFPNDTTTFELVFDEEWKIAPMVNWSCNTVVSSPQYEIITIENVISGFMVLGRPKQINAEQTPPFGMRFPTNKNILRDVKNISGIEDKSNQLTDSQTLHQYTKASKDLVVYNKRKSSVWWWLLPIPLLLFFAGYYWKKQRDYTD